MVALFRGSVAISIRELELGKASRERGEEERGLEDEKKKDGREAKQHVANNQKPNNNHVRVFPGLVVQFECLSECF